MNIARYWGVAEAQVQGPDRAYLLTIRRGSDISPEDAQQRAEEAAAEIAARCETGQEPPDSYAYSTRQLPEPILEEIHNAEGERVGAITINRFGCEVLNTSRLAFLDIDLMPSKKRTGGLLSRLFGSAPTPSMESTAETAVEGAISQLRSWVQSKPGSGVRVYRTSAGLRYLFVRPQMNPNDALHEPVYEELGCDPLYRRLCVAQECFRARLTAKPWRIGVPTPESWRVDLVEERPDYYDRWHKEYLSKAGEYAACRFLEGCGEQTSPDETTDNLIRVHDERSGAGSGLALA
ncbi:MAG: hypothetical protein ACNA8P_06065 [Phycisphaerales bacterium]